MEKKNIYTLEECVDGRLNLYMRTAEYQRRRGSSGHVTILEKHCPPYLLLPSPQRYTYFPIRARRKKGERDSI